VRYSLNVTTWTSQTLTQNTPISIF
jgi:hypothetical protein